MKASKKVMESVIVSGLALTLAVTAVTGNGVNIAAKDLSLIHISYHCWGAVGKIRYGFWDYCRGYLCLYWPGVQGKVLGMETVW